MISNAIAAIILIFFALMLVYALSQPKSKNPSFEGLRQWRKDERVYFKYHSAMGCKIISVYEYSTQRNKMRELGGVNITKYPDYTEDVMIQYIIDTDSWYYTIHWLYDPWDWRII